MRGFFLSPICVAALLTLSLPAQAAGPQDPQWQKAGMLSCEILPHTGINLLIHSTRDIRCIFESENSGPDEYYKGETGIGFGLDIGFSNGAKIAYTVLATHFKPGTHQLAGKYSGAGGNATLGISAGDSAPIAKDDRSISLQPIGSSNSGAGVRIGFSYIYLEPDRVPADKR